MKTLTELQSWLNEQNQETKNIIDDVIWASIGMMEEIFGKNLEITEAAGYKKLKYDILRHAIDKEFKTNNGWEK